MQYRKLVKNGDLLSLIGFGCMRFTYKGINVDEDKAFNELKYAYDNGVNYFDTAYIYCGGKSEVLLGKFIKKYNIRDKVFIADKLPTFLISKKSQIKSFFETQLKRLDTNYIDYYLMHMLDSYHSWKTLKDYGVIEFLENKKKNGEIRYIGFSFHGRCEEFIKILEDYNWDFCQIQYNYLDEYNQAGIKGLKRAYELGVGVVVMEPLRGGSLVNKVPTEVIKEFNSYSKERSLAEWGLKWIFNHEEVSVVLSGMNDIKQVDENIRIASETKVDSMSKNEIKVVDNVKEIFRKLMKVPCTGCKYCMPCPFEVDIPAVFTDYNNKSFFGGFQVRQQYITRKIGGTGYEKSGADLCKSCMKCVKHCPQNIDIPKKLKEADNDLDNIFIKTGLKLAYKYTSRKKNK